MRISNQRVSAHRANQVFKFLIKDGAVTRATVTIHAEDLDAAWNWVHALFPGTDLSDTELEHAGHLSLDQRAVQAQTGSAMS